MKIFVSHGFHNSTFLVPYSIFSAVPCSIFSSEPRSYTVRKQAFCKQFFMFALEQTVSPYFTSFMKIGTLPASFLFEHVFWILGPALFLIFYIYGLSHVFLFLVVFSDSLFRFAFQLTDH